MRKTSMAGGQKGMRLCGRFKRCRESDQLKMGVTKLTRWWLNARFPLWGVARVSPAACRRPTHTKPPAEEIAFKVGRLHAVCSAGSGHLYAPLGLSLAPLVAMGPSGDFVRVIAAASTRDEPLRRHLVMKSDGGARLPDMASGAS
ncbi:hypothetical protein PCL_01500 [Purpureocillium lilacinum]|uniref:Uncharacterized protein n=1 Tax=Purpureocillium lilacinum TaxID=33203 RepID=A0A2U3E3M2_PURLI|nr:hypothetical protein PCL_01500 [Purpureocillium lilacinum]